MKKFLLFILFCGNINYFCFAQQQGEDKNKAEALHVAYLTKELELSPEEAQKFWPVYNNYRSDLKKARQEQVDELAWEEQALLIRKKYKEEFRKIFSNEQRANRVFKTERNFREMLKKEMLRRRANGNQRPAAGKRRL